MELYTKEELDEFKKLVKEINENGQFENTSESINNCIQLIDDCKKEENNEKNVIN